MKTTIAIIEPETPAVGPCPICGEPGCMGNECSPPSPEPLDCCHCGGRGHVLGVDCEWCDGTGEE